MSLKKRIILLGLALLSIVSANAQDNSLSLDVKFDGPKTVKVGGETIKFNGPFSKGADGQQALAYGSQQNGPRIPAEKIVGESGTIIFTFMTKPRKPENQLRNRMILTLRGDARERVLFYQCGSDETLYFAFKKFTDPQTLRSIKPIEFNRWHQVACTWDGSTVKYFLDGILQGECQQPYVPKFPAGASFFYFGPFIDGATNPEPWGEDSCLIRDLKVYKRAMPLEEIMAAAGVKAVDASKQFQPFLAVPMVAVAPAIDGVISDNAWQRASSMITLIDGQKPEESFSYKDNNPKFCYDGNNLYVGFSTQFSATYKLLKGSARSDRESEVWADESFEFYLDIAGKFYRFAGNMAGGYCESLNGDTTFNGNWQYKTTVAAQIDNTTIWQGELCIPFETLGIANPAEKAIKVNFGRTWRGLERIGITALAGSENYDKKELFATLKLSGSDTAFQEIAVNNPNLGRLEQKLQAFSSKNTNLEYTVKLLSSGGFAPEKALVTKAESIKSGVVEQFTVSGTIESTSYDRLLFQVKDSAKSELLMQQVVPFKVLENYLDVIPAFSSAKVYVTPRYMLVKGKADGNPVQVEIISSQGKSIFNTVISSNNELVIPFARDNVTGIYNTTIYSVIDGKKKVFTSKAFNYHGVGSWEKTIPEERVLPPFEPMTVSGDKGNFDVGMWGRVYQYKNSLLPSTITALKLPVLTAASLTVNGKEIANPLKVTKSAPYRVELAGKLNSLGYDLEQNTWIEYDGVLWNSITIKAKENLAGITLKLDIPESMAKFYHATSAGFGGGGRRTEAIDKDIAMPFWPVIWIGGQEQGLCWFAESSAAWKTSDSTPIRIIRANGQTSLQINFADKLAKGQDIKLEFGLVATPVKPLPKNYPFTMLGDRWGARLNQKPPHQPVTAMAIFQNHNAGEGFFDINFYGASTSDLLKNALDDLKICNENNVIFAPYQISLFLPEEYQAVKDNHLEWQTSPENPVTSQDYGKPYIYYNLCTASQASNYYIYRFKEMLKTLKLKGVYFDFGVADTCSNRYHGCNGGYRILAKREFYKRIAGALADLNNGEYAIALHNSESVQIPSLTFATHLLNGEGLRQMSSSTFHGGKDLLDTYTITDFASEHSSLPWGITSSIYVPTEPLLPQFGGGKEPQELYRFRMTKAAMAGALVHNTIPCQTYNHYGWYDKVIRFYDDFKVNQAEFIPYWRNGEYVKVLKGKDIYVSFYRHHDKKELLAVISHISKAHTDQDVVVEFDLDKLGFKKLTSATELLTGLDPEYKRLYAEHNRDRDPVELGDFGVEFKGLENNRIKLKLKHHSVAIVKIIAE